MNQHYVPQVYLRQWCAGDGRLVRYWRVGRKDVPRLCWDRRSPRGICWEEDLYTLPAGSSANGLAGDQLEHLLSTKVDTAIRTVVASIGGYSGGLDPTKGARAKWLMQTFVARSPSLISALESDMADWAIEHEPLIERMLARAMTAEMRTELRGYLAPQMPAAAARAGLAAIAGSVFTPMAGWYGGTVHVLQAASVTHVLAALGLDHFPTFDEPVLQWEENEAGLIASFALCPTALMLVLTERAVAGWELALRHVVAGLRHRRIAICRSEVPSGPWLSAAENLVPSTRCVIPLPAN